MKRKHRRRSEPRPVRAQFLAAAVPGTVLARESPDWRDAEQDLAGLLQDHHWMIVNATDGANQRIDALFLDAEQSFEFRFYENRLHVQGGCNGLRAAFQVGADDRLEVTGAMSTQMACEPPLMEADATLAALMAEPLQLVRVRGPQPTLVMLTATGDALVLTGELTPEARFGPPATIFLEIAAQAVACDGSTRGDGLCLQVRERNFDEQGLLVGTPSEWQPFTADIQGYEHQPGIRNVVRVKRFQPPAEVGMAAEPLTPAQRELAMLHNAPFSRLDRDGDGVLSEVELPITFGSSFDRADKDQSGGLSPEEWAAEQNRL